MNRQDFPCSGHFLAHPVKRTGVGSRQPVELIFPAGNSPLGKGFKPDYTGLCQRTNVLQIVVSGSAVKRHVHDCLFLHRRRAFLQQFHRAGGRTRNRHFTHSGDAARSGGAGAAVKGLPVVDARSANMYMCVQQPRQRRQARTINYFPGLACRRYNFSIPNPQISSDHLITVDNVYILDHYI